MKTVKIIIERSEDAYWAYAENVEGITGVGDTVQEAKQSALDCIEILKELNDTPKVLKAAYSVIFKFDTQSLLNYYKGIFSNASFERITGINQKQLHHYSTGLKKPREAQAKKIETALHKLGSELMAVEL
jgi:predicted RNase H-like HicB family nuclease